MRCAILKLASEPSVGPDRLVSLAKSVGPPTSHSLQDQWAESEAWLGAVSGRIEERVFAGLSTGRGVTEGGTHTKGAGDGEVPRLLASAGARGTQTSAGRREAVPGSGESGSGERSSSTGSRGIKRPGFSKTVPGWLCCWRLNGRRPPQARVWSLDLSIT